MLNRLMLLTATASLMFGPPSVKIELMRNPATAPVKGAVFMVTGRHHSDAAGFSVTGRAEGFVNGKRISRPLHLTPAGPEGVFGVLAQWQIGEPWVLIFTVTEGGHDEHGIAEGMVKIARDGSLKGIEYPLGTLPQGTPWPRKVTSAEITSALKSLSLP